MTQKQIIINGLLINYYTTGEGNVPIIFLHGWRSEAAVWLPLFKTLTAKPYTLYPISYTLYALDLPGFGQSETPKNPFTLHDYAEIIKEFITTLYPLPSTLNPSIIGHSFGARIAVKLAAEHPEIIQKLILVDCGGIRGHRIKRAFLNSCAKIVKPFFAPRFMQPLRAKIYTMLNAEDYSAARELKKTYLNIIREPLEPLFPRITTPTLIIWGEKDQETPLAYGEKMHRAIRGSRFAVIKDAGHFCFMDQPEKCVKILKPFLT